MLADHTLHSLGRETMTPWFAQWERRQLQDALPSDPDEPFSIASERRWL